MSRRHSPRPAGVKPADWDFLSFPTFFGFSFGMFVATFLILFGLIDIVYLVSLMAVAFSLAHLLTRSVARFRRDRQRERSDEAERERRALEARARASAEPAGEAEVKSRRRRRRR
jgi:hypothetical protein